MEFPNDKKLKEIRKRLEKAEPSRALSKNASKADELKFKICEKFVSCLLDQKISQAELARQLDIDPARLNEIVKYRIDLFTLDKLLDLAERLDPNIRVDVA